MDLQFLWDEEKTRKFLKFQVITIVLGVPVAIVYIYLSLEGPGKWVMIPIALSLFFYCLVNWIFINKPYPGIRLLIHLLLVQVIVVAFMAAYGGFNSFFQFATYAALFIAVNQLGSKSATILGYFSVITFLGLFFWQTLFDQKNAYVGDFVIFCFFYILIFLIQRDTGKELSVQFDAKKKLEYVDDLKNQFISLSSHYLRTPLGSIKNILTKMQKDQSELEKQQDLEGIKTQVLRLESLLEKLLTISLVERGKVQVSRIDSDLDSIIKSIIVEFEPLAKEKGVNLLYECPLPPARFDFDPIKIKECVLLMVDNAIRYNQTGGSVKVTLAGESTGVVFSVADNGVGISSERVDTIFEAFNKGGMEQTLQFDNAGPGLSLYLTKLIIEAHNGKISVSSTKGKGTVFTVWLPTAISLR